MGIASLNEHLCVSGNLYFTTSFFVFYSAHWRKNIVIVVDFDMALHLVLNFDVYFQAYAAGGGSMVALM